MSSDLASILCEVLCTRWFLELFSLTGQYTQVASVWLVVVTRKQGLITRLSTASNDCLLGSVLLKGTGNGRLQREGILSED
jgi:hypothetical protein